jgi:hypothetical protein
VKHSPSLCRLALVVAVVLPSLALSATQWTYRLNGLDLGLGLDLIHRSERPVVADATGELLTVGIGANVYSDWGIAAGATLARVTITTTRDLVGGQWLVGPCVTYGVGSTRNQAVPVFSLTAQAGWQASLAELRAEWGSGIIKRGLRLGCASYVDDANQTILAPFVGVYVGLGGWGTFTKRGGSED